MTSPAEGSELRTHPWVMLWEGCLLLALWQGMVVGTGISRTRGVAERRGTKVSEPWKRCVPNTRTVSSSALMGRLWASTSLGGQEFREPRLREAAGAADPGRKARDLRLRPGPAVCQGAVAALTSGRRLTGSLQDPGCTDLPRLGFPHCRNNRAHTQHTTHHTHPRARPFQPAGKIAGHLPTSHLNFWASAPTPAASRSPLAPSPVGPHIPD